MVVGICQIDLLIHQAHSLKEKRKVLKAVVERVKNKFNASVAETGDNDVWQRSQIGLSVVGNDSGHINSTLDAILNFIESLHLAEVVDHKMEIITDYKSTSC
ncbi:MAG: DUF503 domain-containing protein [Deltaproteobacteria bacterium]|nr:DUF503 domain-containing protein [Deltaproteobacteria bacterium]